MSIVKKAKPIYKDMHLNVDFGEENKELLFTWRRLCLALESQGGVKKRLIRLVEEDLERLKQEVLKTLEVRN